MLRLKLNKWQLKKININCKVELLRSYTTVLFNAVLKGFLSGKLSSIINLINIEVVKKIMSIRGAHNVLAVRLGLIKNSVPRISYLS